MKDISFLALLDQYMTYRFVRPTTVKSYYTAVRVFRKHLGPDVYPSMVTRDVVMQWRRAVLRSHLNPDGIAETSWNNYTRHLSSLFSFGIKHQMIQNPTNPFEQSRVTEPRKPKKVLQPAEIRYAREVLETCRQSEDAFRDASSLHPAWFWQAVVETFYYTGIRLNQLLHITAGDVSLKKRWLLISAQGSKTHSEMVLPIPEGLMPYLSQLIVTAHGAGFKRSDQLFNVNRFSQRHKSLEMNIWQVENFFKKLSALCGCKLSPHRFRHFLGTDLMNSPEKNIHLTQKILNHTNIKTTLEYVHPDIEAMRHALENRLGV